MHEGQICSLTVSKAVKAKSSIPKGKTDCDKTSIIFTYRFVFITQKPLEFRHIRLRCKICIVFFK